MNAELKSCNVFLDMTFFNPTEYFTDYHYFEKFDQTKEYNSETFKKDYGYGELNYKYTLHLLNETEKYIVAVEDLSESDLKELIPYCRCSYHVMSWISPARLSVCKCCVGCLESHFPTQSVINDSRKYMKKMKIINKYGSNYLNCFYQ